MRAFLAGAAAASLVSVTFSAQAAVPSWTTQELASPSKHTYEIDEPSAPTCWGPAECVVVDGYAKTTALHGDTGDYYGALVVTIHGKKQQAIDAPIPANGAQDPPDRDAALSDAYCRDAQNCVAVGFYYTSAGKRLGMIDTETAGVWSSVEAPLRGSFIDLTGIDCNTDQCAAVGTTGPGDGVILAPDTSGTWVRQDLTTPTGMNNATDMTDVSCPTSGSCYALGRTGPARAPRQVLFHPDGSGWTGDYLAAPSGADPTQLGPGRLACSSAGHCAVLTLWSSSDGRRSGLAAEVLADGVLSSAPVSLPAGASAYYPPAGMDCPSDTSCFGVDPAAHLGGGVDQPLIVQGSGASWTAVVAPSLPKHPDAPTFLQDVSCSSSTDCTATGGLATKRSVVDTFTGGSWLAEALPAPGNLGNFLSADHVDCTGGRCVISGHYLVDVPRNGHSDSAFVSVSGSS